MSTPLIHTQVARRDGEDVWFTFTLSRMPDTRWKLHFCLARHIDPDSLQGGELERQSGAARSYLGYYVAEDLAIATLPAPQE